MKALKKVGWFIVSFLPAGLSLALQLACGYGLLYYYYFQVRAERRGTGDSKQFLMMLASAKYAPNALYGVLLYQVLALIVFGIWYYAVWGKKKRPAGVERAGFKRLPVIIVMGVLLQFFISGVLNLLMVFRPEWFIRYMQMIQAAGIMNMSVPALIATVIMAPIGEELLCRGIILKLAGKVTKKFWLANMIQALAFGMIHANWVQGIYAFVLGLVLGYLYGKYHNLWLCMLLHGSINLSSNFVDHVYLLFPEEYGMLCLIGVTVVCMLLLAVCFLIMGRIKHPEEDRIVLSNRYYINGDYPDYPGNGSGF